MPGASQHTKRVTNLNANWNPDTDPPHGRFEVQLITEDNEQHALTASPESMTALVSLARAESVLAWDPINRTLIAANIVGTMAWTQQV